MRSEPTTVVLLDNGQFCLKIDERVVYTLSCYHLNGHSARLGLGTWRMSAKDVEKRFIQLTPDSRCL